MAVEQRLPTFYHHLYFAVDSPCKMGCSGMAFCSNFNNRPTDLFRSCDVEGDEIARESFK